MLISVVGQIYYVLRPMFNRPALDRAMGFTLLRPTDIVFPTLGEMKTIVLPPSHPMGKATQISGHTHLSTSTLRYQPFCIHHRFLARGTTSSPIIFDPTHAISNM